MILDQPFEEEKPVVLARQRFTWYEKIIIAIALLIVLYREATSSLWAYEVMIIVCALVAFSYLLAYYWIDIPKIRTVRTVIISILYGIGFSVSTFAFIFIYLFIIGAKEMIYVSAIFIGAVLIIDLATSVNKVRVASKYTFTRIAAFVVVIGMLYFIPESARISFTYRKYPGFVRYYKEQKAQDKDIRFDKIFDDYRRNNNIPNGELR